jgi:hypothetical protein
LASVVIAGGLGDDDGDGFKGSYREDVGGTICRCMSIVNCIGKSKGVNNEEIVVECGFSAKHTGIAFRKYIYRNRRFSTAGTVVIRESLPETPTLKQNSVNNNQEFPRSPARTNRRQPLGIAGIGIPFLLSIARNAKISPFMCDTSPSSTITFAALAAQPPQASLRA